MQKRLEDKNIEIQLTEKAKDYLIENGYDAIYGARPLKRFVQKKLETLFWICSRNIMQNMYFYNQREE